MSQQMIHIVLVLCFQEMLIGILLLRFMLTEGLKANIGVNVFTIWQLLSLQRLELVVQMLVTIIEILLELPAKLKLMLEDQHGMMLGMACICFG
jgi:hypothetical protein